VVFTRPHGVTFCLVTQLYETTVTEKKCSLRRRIRGDLTIEFETNDSEFDIQRTARRDILIMKPRRCTNFSNLFLE
jgi:hypothetical protein